MVSLTEIKAAFDNGSSGGGTALLRHSRVKSNRNSSNLLHVKMFSAARLDGAWGTGSSGPTGAFEHSFVENHVREVLLNGEIILGTVHASSIVICE